MFKLFNKKHPETSNKSNTSSIAVTKGLSAVQQAIASSYGNNNDDLSSTSITPRSALRYYDKVAPVATAVDIVNDEFKTLTLVLEDADGKITHTAGSPLLKFLKQPNDDMVQIDFLENLGSYYLITNEVYLIATGAVNRAPAEVYVISPVNVEVKVDADGVINRFEMNRGTGGKEVFTRAAKGYRFFNADSTAEIWQIKGFNSGDTSRGKSKLNSAHYEIEQYLQCSAHNLSILNNGVRSSGAFLAEGALTDEQFDRLREQLTSKSGADNAGKNLILEGGLGYKEMSISPKDMDFATLKKTTTEAIFRRYKIPLALVSTESMAEATMETSSLMLYDNAVLPVARRLLAEITRFLGPRFDVKDDSMIAPFMDNITALQIRRIKEVKNKKEVGVFTINEIRGVMGEEGIGAEGDIVYIASNLVPAGAESQQADPAASGQVGIDGRQPAGDIDMESDTPTDDAKLKTSRSGFIAILKQQVDLNKNRTFTDEEIVALADQEGL